MFINLRPCKLPQTRGNRYVQTMTDTLVLLHVIFRHGDRTPDKPAIYPNDPHKEFDYSPYGYGQLTNAGKKRAYRLGFSLRKRYGDFLDESYKAELLDAWASDFNRTQMTLQLVLASLYKPKNEQVWNEDMPWQPIPYHCTPKKDDKMFLAFHMDKWAVTEYNNYVNGEGKDILKFYADSINYIEHHTGVKMKSPRSAFNLSCTLSIQESMGFKLPEWTKEVYPHRIEEIAMLDIDFITATPLLRSLVFGKLLQKIVADSMSKINGKSKYQVHLYSGHDFTVGMFLKIIDMFDCRHPDFCSNVAIELHNIDGIYGFMIKYQRTEGEDPKLLCIPNVGTFWPIEHFVHHYTDLLESRPYDLLNK